MIHEALECLKNVLNDHMKSGVQPSDPQEDPVVFLVGQNMDALNFKLGAVTVILLNLEQENALRAPDLYSRTLADGTVQKIQPDIRLNLYVLFVAHYQQYQDGLRNLSAIIRFFQNHRVLDHHNTPALSENIEQLVIELVTLTFAEQNEVWGSLRLPYHPSALYKVRMIVFQDEAATQAPAIEEKISRVSS
jgi:hypothetical protein